MTLRYSTAVRNKQSGINTNMITNGAFTSATTGWTAVTATLTSVAGGQSGNCLTVAESGGVAVGQAYQEITTIVGHIYKFTGYFKIGTSANGKFLIGITEDPDSLWDSGNLSDADWAQHTCAFVATATTTRITCQTNDVSAGETSLFDTLVLVDKANSIQDIFYLGQIEIRTGLQPATADTVPSGDILVTIKYASAGISFSDAVSGVLPKNADETWSGTCVDTDTAGWFRLCLSTDLGTTNTTDVRIDGAVTVLNGGGEMQFTSTAFVIGAVETLTDWQLTDPME